MSGIRIYEAYKGWIYEVWFQGRVVVIGCHATLEAAQRAAAAAELFFVRTLALWNYGHSSYGTALCRASAGRTRPGRW